jgi:hypothetical protein
MPDDRGEVSKIEGARAHALSRWLDYDAHVRAREAARRPGLFAGVSRALSAPRRAYLEGRRDYWWRQRVKLMTPIQRRRVEAAALAEE